MARLVLTILFLMSFFWLVFFLFKKATNTKLSQQEADNKHMRDVTNSISQKPENL